MPEGSCRPVASAPEALHGPEDYHPEVVVWELTLACNFRCLHCGSACKEVAPGELSPTEALRVCDELAALGTRQVTLSGGEPLLRADWPAICARLTGSAIGVSLITNGWLVDAPLIARARAAGLSRLGVSLDGLEETHDAIRCPGSFQRVVAALGAMRDAGFPAGAITTVLRRNLPELPQVGALLEKLGVGLWQVQIGCPMGSLSGQHDEVITPGDVPEILRFAQTVRERGRTEIQIGDCLGYFTKTSSALRAAMGPGAQWAGCPAGRFGLGIRHDGGVCGCNTLRDATHIEGNLRETRLAELWRRPGAFAWNRQRDRGSLTGFCRRCQFGALCLGGCTNVRETMSPSTGENPYCGHRVAIESLLPGVQAMTDAPSLMGRARRAAELGLYEVADSCLTRLFALHSFSLDSLLLAGHVAYRVGDFERCRDHNERALRMDPASPYAMKGLGLALAELGQADEALMFLQRSVSCSPPDLTDPLEDLATFLRGVGRDGEADQMLARAHRRKASSAQTEDARRAETPSMVESVSPGGESSHERPERRRVP